jgi:hypothetical protein
MGVDLKIAPALKVAYILGTGDDVAQSVEDIGVHVTMLSRRTSVRRTFRLTMRSFSGFGRTRRDPNSRVPIAGS